MSDVDDLKTYTELSKRFRHSLVEFVRGVERLKGGKSLIERSSFPHRWIEVETLRVNLLARELHAYMEFRAGRENVRHGFDVEFYVDALAHKRTEVFFGVHVGEASLLWDAQNPAAFRAWKAKAHPGDSAEPSAAGEAAE